MTVPPEGSDERDLPIGPETTMSFNAVPAADAPDVVEGGLAPADQAAVEALPAGSALLVVQRGPNTGARFLLDAERTTAGRRPESDIFLDDVTVSRKHAEFLRRDRIADLPAEGPPEVPAGRPGASTCLPTIKIQSKLLTSVDALSTGYLPPPSESGYDTALACGTLGGYSSVTDDRSARTGVQSAQAASPCKALPRSGSVIGSWWV